MKGHRERVRRAGDVVSLAARVEHADDHRRLAAIVGLEDELGLAHVVLVTTDTLGQTDADVRFEPGELGFPMAVLVQTDLVATVRQSDLARRMGTLGDRWTAKVIALALTGVLDESLRDRTGLPLLGEGDPRVALKRTEHAALLSLAAPVLHQYLHELVVEEPVPVQDDPDPTLAERLKKWLEDWRDPRVFKVPLVSLLARPFAFAGSGDVSQTWTDRDLQLGFMDERLVGSWCRIFVHRGDGNPEQILPPTKLETTTLELQRRRVLGPADPDGSSTWLEIQLLPGAPSGDD